MKKRKKHKPKRTVLIGVTSQGILQSTIFQLRNKFKNLNHKWKKWWIPRDLHQQAICMPSKEKSDQKMWEHLYKLLLNIIVNQEFSITISGKLSIHIILKLIRKPIWLLEQGNLIMLTQIIRMDKYILLKQRNYDYYLNYI